MLTCPDRTETIDLPNLSAGIGADKRRYGTPEFYELLREFINTFKSSGFDISYCDGTPTSVIRAF